MPCVTAILRGHADFSFEALKKVIVDDEPELDLTVLGGNPGSPARGLLGDVHIAGPPRTDFAMMGRRRCTDGITMIAFLIWVRMLLVVQPAVVIFENVTLFPVSLLQNMLGAL